MSTTNQPLQTLKGFRDFLPLEKQQRDFVLNKVKQTFELYGFEPLETPTLEYADLLLGKYGQEADQLVYTFQDRGQRQIGLRYDQTVPTARILAQYQHQLPRYFRRYQIQNVFRADKPQKGRFREFTQCDIDIFGATAPIADAEILACTYAAFQNVGFNQVELSINDRQILFKTLKPIATQEVDVFSIIQSIDKLDKISEEQVLAELTNKGLDHQVAEQALTAIQQAQISVNLQDIIDQAVNLGVPQDKIKFNSTLARGLDYYTGMIFEVILPNYQVGSCGGGGRYDNLIAELGGLKMPAVGIAFGFDRMVEAAAKLGIFKQLTNTTQVLVTLFAPETRAVSLQTAQKLRQAGIKTEVYPEFDKLSKQFKLADQKKLAWVIVIGEKELAAQTVSLKNMASGEQTELSLEKAIKQLKKTN
ncbi:MAG: histidine--tRNA ligase [Candidatus Pacebacteria bacterium]|nr:histidine--tRNA ligase [Candidatus Paceibacterota bacterium]